MNIEKHLLLTKMVTSDIIATAGETEAGSAGEQPARDNWSGGDDFTSWGVCKLPAHFYSGYTYNRNCPHALKKRTFGVNKIVTKTDERFFHFTLNQYTSSVFRLTMSD